jgi:hypothetical protein
MWERSNVDGGLLNQGDTRAFLRSNRARHAEPKLHQNFGLNNRPMP